MKYPKFQEKLLTDVIQPHTDQDSQSSYGIVLSYDSLLHTASVAMSQKGSDDIGQIYHNVPCPVTVGIQTVAPEPGRPAWVVFKDNSFNFPVISHYFNHAYSQIDYGRQTRSFHYTPRYMLGS